MTQRDKQRMIDLLTCMFQDWTRGNRHEETSDDESVDLRETATLSRDDDQE